MSLRNLWLSNYDFSRNFYEEFFRKYFWRDWLVVVLIYIEGYYDVYFRVCNGVIKLVYRIKDIVIDSVEYDKVIFDISEVYGLCVFLI